MFIAIDQDTLIAVNDSNKTVIFIHLQSKSSYICTCS